MENRVTRDSLVWRDGWPQWLVAENVFDDYFGPTVPAQLNPAAAPSNPAAPVSHMQAAASASTEASSGANAPVAEFKTPTLSDRALAARKRQRKKNYMIMIAVLATISIGLVIALVVVLMKNM